MVWSSASDGVGSRGGLPFRFFSFLVPSSPSIPSTSSPSGVAFLFLFAFGLRRVAAATMSSAMRPTSSSVPWTISLLRASRGFLGFLAFFGGAGTPSPSWAVASVAFFFARGLAAGRFRVG
ncbi:hypothetical protein IG631_11899 [Alternaria alternata]|nr:hypothetical protein IG631_11899 [Alternaria alternata]